MRRLRVLYTLSRGGVPVLVMASLVPAFDGCAADDAPDPGTRVDASVTDAAGESDARDSGDISVEPSEPFDGRLPPGRDVTIKDIVGEERGCNPGMPPDPRYPYPPPVRTPRPCCDFYVDLPPEGTPALIDSICLDIGDAASASGWAARAAIGENTANGWIGSVAIAPALASRVVGLPTVTLLDVSLPQLANGQISNVRAGANGGFNFNALFPNLTSWGEGVRITLEVTFVVRCNEEGGPPNDGPETTRTVQSLSNLVFCAPNLSSPMWVSSGDICNVCAIIAEMAPTPIVPGRHEDPLPLGEALRLNVKTIARVGRSLVLLADHDGGSGAHEYAWKASAGELTRVADDIVVWTPPDDAMLELVQVAVESPSAAAVASLRWDRAA
jgi:hypothetical protein